MYPNNLKHFQASEFSDPDRMNHDLLYRLDALREYLNTEIFISSSTGGDHVSNSQHYLGNAVDVLFPKWQGSLMSLFLIIERFGFSGIGIYPKWKINSKTIGGFHLDVRTVSKFQYKRWIGIPRLDESKNKVITAYLPFNMINLSKQGLIPS